MGNDHLRVGLGAQSSRFKERLLVPDALAVDVEASLHIVDSVDNEIEALPQLVIENFFGFWGAKRCVSLHI